MFTLIPTDPYRRSLKRIIKNNEQIKKRVIKSFQLLMQDPRHPSLKSHKVNTPDYGQRWSSHVTGDIRIIWDYDNENRVIILLLDIGNHSGTHKVYK